MVESHPQCTSGGCITHYCPSFRRQKGAHGHLRGSGRDLTPSRLPDSHRPSTSASVGVTRKRSHWRDGSVKDAQRRFTAGFKVTYFVLGGLFPNQQIWLHHSSRWQVPKAEKELYFVLSSKDCTFQFIRSGSTMPQRLENPTSLLRQLAAKKGTFGNSTLPVFFFLAFDNCFCVIFIPCYEVFFLNILCFTVNLILSHHFKSLLEINK